MILFLLIVEERQNRAFYIASLARFSNKTYKMDSDKFIKPNPAWYNLDMYKKCVKCNQRKDILEFNFKDKAKGRRNARCRLCTRKSIMAAYYKNRSHYLKYRSVLNRIKRQWAASFFYNYLSAHPCVDCGINDPVVLQFDHVRGKKKFEIGKMSNGRYSMKLIIAEIKKCDVRCANCHSRKTAREQQWYAIALESAIAN